MGIYSKRIEVLINAALADGEITEKERAVLINRAKEEGIDPDEFEMVLDARCLELNTVKKGEVETKEEKEQKNQDKEDKKVLIVLAFLLANGFLAYLLINLL